MLWLNAVMAVFVLMVGCSSEKCRAVAVQWSKLLQFAIVLLLLLQC